MDVLINGERWIKETSQPKQSIGIGITTHNRNKLCASTVAKIRELTPNARIVVVDDASELPVKIIDTEVYRFRRNVGIARAKNKCIELLYDCDHIFLFDDDTYPLRLGWQQPYVDSAEHHLMYLFETWSSGQNIDQDAVLYEDGNIVAHKQARGCMIYIDRTVIETVGGMDVRYGKAMNEHLDYTNRIFNAGLTTFRNMDVPGSADLIYSMDEHQEVRSSISRAERMLHLNKNNDLLTESYTSARYAPYGKDVVIACYFSGVPDVQRNNERWTADFKPIQKLKQSVESKGYEFVLIHNCFEYANLTTIQGSPYFERWLKEWQYLRDHPDINNVFVVDATDVDMLNDPFPHLERGKLYVGDEPAETLSNTWLLKMHREQTVNSYLTDHPELPMLNCGVVGGDRQTVMDLCRDLYLYGIEHPTEQTEMGAFNYFMHSKYSGIMEYGRQVTTLFKRYERYSKAWFRHK